MTDAPQTPLPLPRRTTPTWDMELLVSAASVFALLQLPGWLDAASVALTPRLDLDWEVMLRLLYTYAKLGVLLLAGAFALHLAMRAYWIGLVGLDSIYPTGVRWEGLRYGPVRRRFLQARTPAMADRIEAADNRASIVFALGLTMAAFQVALLVYVGAAYVVALALRHTLGWDWMVPNGIFAIIILTSLPYAIAASVDRWRGASLAADGRAARAIAATYAAYARLGYGARGGNALDLLQSHHGARKAQGWAMAAVLACGVIAVGQAWLQEGRLALGDYARWPAAESRRGDSLVTGHYRDQAPASSSLLPSIDTAFPEREHLVLVVPFDPKRLPAHLDQACPATWGGADSPARRAALLECVGGWLALRIDGAPLPPPRLRYTTVAGSGQHALLAVLPIGALAPGEHVLAVRRAQPARQGARDLRGADYQIVFWK